jgi:hypothetical protein
VLSDPQEPNVQKTLLPAVLQLADFKGRIIDDP